jgi:hypothetical protein
VYRSPPSAGPSCDRHPAAPSVASCARCAAQLCTPCCLYRDLQPICVPCLRAAERARVPARLTALLLALACSLGFAARVFPEVEDVYGLEERVDPLVKLPAQGGTYARDLWLRAVAEDGLGDFAAAARDYHDAVVFHGNGALFRALLERRELGQRLVDRVNLLRSTPVNGLATGLRSDETERGRRARALLAALK